MTDSLQNKAKSLLPITMDVLFALWLFTEVAMEHSTASRVCMALFVLGALVWMVVSKKAFFSLWMPFMVLLIVWSLIGAQAFALNRSAAMDAVQTLCINLAFLFALYQYLLLRKNLPAVYLAYCAATAALVLYVLLQSWPLDITVLSRFGVDADVNPNWIGMLAAFAFAMSLDRGLHKNPWWLLACVFFGAAVLLTKSTKAYGIVGILAVALVLMRWPKYWGLKLIAIAAVVWFLFRVVLWRTNSSYDIFFQKIRYMYENLFMGWDHDNSLSERTAFASVGWNAFLQRPLTGYGLDGFRFLEGSKGTYSHCNYVELLVAGGLPMVALYYAPQLAALWRGIRKLGDRMVRFAFLLTCVQLVMDVAMVAYIDRTALMIPVLLFAAVRLAQNQKDDGTRFFALLQNPCAVVRWCSTRGRLQWMPDEWYLKLLYRGCMGKKLHLNPPRTMNEKLQWTKLHDHNPLYPKLVDKLAVRDYVAKKAGEDVLIPLLGSWGNAEQIDFDALPNRFVLKCTHDSGGVRICFDAAAFDRAEAVRFLNRRLQKSYYPAGREWPYKALQPRILAEAFIGEADGKAPDDVKLYCFDGVVRAVMICQNRTKSHADYYYFDRDFAFLPIGETTRKAMAEGKTFTKPPHLSDMIRLAETLSAGLPQLRVDLYDTNGKVWFGELTLFDQSGFATDYGDEGDTYFGQYFHLPEANA